MKHLISKNILALFVGIFIISCSEQHVEELNSLDSSIMKSKFDWWSDFISISDPVEYDKSFDITQNLTPEMEVIYQKALKNVREQLLATKKSTSDVHQVELYPTGIYPDDRINVQTLMNELGAAGIDAQVTLKSKNVEGVPTAFNFGFSQGSASGDGGIAVGGWVVIGPWLGSGSIDFIGERNEEEITTISGGFRFNNFEGGSFFIINRNNDDFSFRDIKFIDEGGLEIAYIESFQLTDCLFENTGGGILHFGGTGATTIENNLFSDVAFGIRVYNNQPDALVIDNEINAYIHGLNIGKIVGSCIIEDNIINSIEVPGYYFEGINLYPFGDGFYQITNNIISCNQEFGLAIDIFSLFDVVKNINIVDNDIYTNSEYSSALIIVDLGYPVTDICVSDNTFTGRASSAIWITNYEMFGFPSSEISDISITDNDFNDYETSCLEIDGSTGLNVGCVDIFLGISTHDITVCDQSGILIDYGTNNTITEDNCPECGL